MSRDYIFRWNTHGLAKKGGRMEIERVDAVWVVGRDVLILGIVIVALGEMS